MCKVFIIIVLRSVYRPFWTIFRLLSVNMSSPSQKHGSCGHIMASFDSHCFCARCREKGKGSDPCISHLDCNACNSLTEEQRIQLSTPSYRIKKEKRELKKVSDTPKQDSSSSLIDPSVVTVVGAVDDQGIVKSPGSCSEKKSNKVRINQNLTLLRFPNLTSHPSRLNLPNRLRTPDLISWTRNGPNVLTDLRPCYYLNPWNNQHRLLQL